MIRVSELKLPVTGNQKALEKKLAKALRVPVEEIKAYRIFKHSLDARIKLLPGAPNLPVVKL